MIKYFTPLLLLALLVFRTKADLGGFGSYPVSAILIFGVGSIAIPIILSFFMPQKILDRK